MKLIAQYKQYLVFAGGGIMALLTIWLVMYMFGFLLSNLTKATDVEPPKNTAVKFDTEGFEKLNLMKK